MKMGVDRYVELFEKVKARVGSDEVATVILEQVGKDNRVRVMQGSSGELDQPGDARVIMTDDAATEKQLAYLKQLGVSCDDNVTRKEASELIDDAVQKAAM